MIFSLDFLTITIVRNSNANVKPDFEEKTMQIVRISNESCKKLLISHKCFDLLTFLRYNTVEVIKVRIFAERLKEERMKANLTQQNMADKLSITRGAYAQYENNMTEPSIETLAKITNILKTSADYLIGRY